MFKKTRVIIASIFLAVLVATGVLVNLFHHINQSIITTQVINAIANLKKNQPRANIINLLPRNINFTGRKHLLSKLKTQLNKQKLGVITQAITGFGGVGKTQLATEFAYQAAERNEYSAIFWIPAETNNSIYSAYKEAASNLQLDVAEMDLENIQNIIHKKLSILYKNTKLLIILGARKAQKLSIAN